MAHPPVVIVNQNDEPVGEAPLAEARAKGLIYRVVFIIVEDKDGRLLLQKRTPNMQVYPNCWEVAAGGHVDDGHTYEEAARLELAEEVGITGADLTEVAHIYTEEPLWGDIPSKRFAKVYHVRTNTPPGKIAEDEVAETRWFTKEETVRLIESHPDQIAEGLMLAYNKKCL